jgi:hypothetical protein
MFVKNIEQYGHNSSQPDGQTADIDQAVQLVAAGYAESNSKVVG